MAKTKVIAGGSGCSRGPQFLGTLVAGGCCRVRYLSVTLVRITKYSGPNSHRYPKFHFSFPNLSSGLSLAYTGLTSPRIYLTKNFAMDSGKSSSRRHVALKACDLCRIRKCQVSKTIESSRCLTALGQRSLKSISISPTQPPFASAYSTRRVLSIAESAPAWKLSALFFRLASFAAHAPSTSSNPNH